MQQCGQRLPGCLRSHKMTAVGWERHKQAVQSMLSSEVELIPRKFTTSPHPVIRPCRPLTPSPPSAHPDRLLTPCCSDTQPQPRAHTGLSQPPPERHRLPAGTGLTAVVRDGVVDVDVPDLLIGRVAVVVAQLGVGSGAGRGGGQGARGGPNSGCTQLGLVLDQVREERGCLCSGSHRGSR